MENSKTTFGLAKKLIAFVLCFGVMLSVTITPMAATPVGDLNGDDLVSAPDLSALTTVLFAGIEDVAYDINGDGKINILDLIRLKKNIALAAISVSAPVDAVDGKVSEGVTISGNGISAYVPAGVLLEDGVDTLTLTVTPLTTSSGDIDTADSETITPYDVHISGISKSNTIPIIIDLGAVMPKFLNIGNYRLYHVEDGVSNLMTLVASRDELDAHNEFAYTPATGELSVAMATFSEVAVVSAPAAWEGKFDYTWYTKTIEENPNATEFTIANGDQLAALGAIVGGMAKDIEIDDFSGKTVKLLADINLGDSEENNVGNKIFYPIGYYNSEGTYERTNTAITSGLRNFEGTFDGNGHTISNFYHNTWEMKGDHDWYSPEDQYYRDGMGLFGRVYGGTVKNLTVDNFSSDGEIATTGVIAAYADGATFENIAITNCNPRVYNIGNGGIVGCIGWYAKEANLKTTFTNITVDNTNKISALWGSYDVACGGIVGQYYPTSGQSSANYPVNAGVDLKNCHVAAQIDVYNDVCGNYQYYAYRYAGMIIGSIRENTTNEDGKTIPNMTGISASGCTVNYGDWNDYYYCEFEKNGHPSYSGPDDYKFSRVPHSELNFTDSNGNGVVDANERDSVTGCKHNHTAAEDSQAIYLPFHQLFTGYGWGVNSIGLEKYSGVITNLDIKEGDATESVKKFEKATTAKEKYNNVDTITIGDLFSVIEPSPSVSIKDAFVNVFVSPVGDDSTASGTYTADKDKWTEGTLTFSGTGAATITITDYNFCTPTTIDVTITDKQPAEKFETKFTGDFLYRVGNTGTVALGTLFEEKDSTEIGTVDVTIDTIQGASGTYSANSSDWTKGTIQFSDTGVVKVTITDNDYCTPTVLLLEVVDATNATAATSATKNNVVLLNDCGFSALEVSGGHTIYGNGFKMTCSSDSYATDRNYSFVELKGGTLDNVQIITPNFSHAIMYEKNKSENGNPSYTDSNGKIRYYNIRSAVIVSATSKISNSYISGGRAAIYATSGTLTLENSTIYGGAVANIQAETSAALILEDVTLIQKPIKATVNDTSKTVMGLSVVTMCDTEGNGTEFELKGFLHQYAWANEDYAEYVPSDAQGSITEIMSKEDYLHSITYEDGVTRDSVNLGFVNMPNGLTTKQENISDTRTNNEEMPYEWVTVKSIANIYTYTNAFGTAAEVQTEPSYKATTQGSVLPNVNYTDTNENRVFTTTYDTIEALWKSTLKVDVDAGNYSFSFDKLLAQKGGTNLSYTVKKDDGTIVDKNTPINLESAVSNVYVLTITDNQIYGKDGNITGETVEHSYIFELLSTKTSLPAPTWTSQTLNGTPYIVVDSKGGDWNCAVPVLDGLKVKYWSKKQNKEIELDLSTVVSAAGLSAGLQNGSNNTITITVADEYTLTITTTGFKSSDNGKPVVVNGTLYFTVSSSSNYVSTDTTKRDITIKYTFTDANNSEPLTLNNGNGTTFSVIYNDYSKTQYKYSDFCNGKLTEASCVTPDTLITLADGTQKRVDELNGDEELLVWNLETGKLDKAPIMFVDSESEAEFEIIHLYFSDGTDVKVIYEHGFWDYDLNKYVYLDRYADKYIGHTFAKQNGDTLQKVTLTDVVLETEITTAWSPVTVGHLCYFVNGMLSMPGGVGGLFNIFEVDPETMTYDYDALQKDIETYGLYTYEELNAIAPLSEEMFYAAGGQYLKISIGKGNLTIDELVYMINRYSKFI